MMDYVMNSSFWPSLCHEDKVLFTTGVGLLKTWSPGPDVVSYIFEKIPLLKSINTSVTCTVQRKCGDVGEGM